ncbi:MAG: HAD-IIIC family phosphatase [Oligoflexia bacterium]|nr:HAD-IIIC family phosphatase [Oligoflexia bacterium]
MENIKDLLRKYNESSDFLTLQKCLNEFSQLTLNKPTQTNLISQRIAVLSNFSTQFICKSLKPSFLNHNIWPEIYEDEYNSWEISTLKSSSALYQFKPDIILFLFSSIQLAYNGSNNPAVISQRISQAVTITQQNSNAKVAITLPEPLEEERTKNSWAFDWRQKLLEALAHDLPKNCEQISIDPLVRQIGSKSWYSPRYYVSSKLPFHPNHTKLFTNFISDVLTELITPKIKLIITDLDNTLWGGIVGEVGADQVDLNYQEKGYGHLRLQKMLLDLNQRGVLLAITSKNNYADAIEVFKKRPEMILKENHFSAIKINWDSKSKNIASILNELNLSTTGVVFLDDMPFEREEVRQSLPDIIIPELGKDPVIWVDTLLDTGLFFKATSTSGDLSRLNLYDVEKKRQSEKTNFKSTEEFLSSLNLVLKVKNYSENKNRVLELISKTNQFNLTTKRHNLMQLESMLQQGGECFVYELEDKFGSYGIISVLITMPDGVKNCIIDTWLMSCRVINRNVEHAVLSHAISKLKKNNVLTIKGEYVPTAKNIIARSLYEDLGFKLIDQFGEKKLYELNISRSEVNNKLKHFCKIEEPDEK